MPGKDDRAGAPGARPGQNRGGSAEDLFRGKDGGGGAGTTLSGNGRDGERGGSGAHSQDRDGRTALGKQTSSGAVDKHDAGSKGRPFQPPASLRAPSALLSRPLFLHPVPQLGSPFRAPSIPQSVPAPLLFSPLAGVPRLPVPADIATAQSQTPDVPRTTQLPADVPSPKVELSVTSSAIDSAQTSVDTASSSGTLSSAPSPAPSPENAIASTPTSEASAPDISPIAATLVDSSLTSPGTSDSLPVTNTGVGVGGKVAAACVIGAVFLLLLNWAFWLVIRRRRRARRSLPAHWDFAAPPPVKDSERDSEDAFAHSEDAERDAKGGMVTVPV